MLVASVVVGCLVVLAGGVKGLGKAVLGSSAVVLQETVANLFLALHLVQ